MDSKLTPSTLYRKEYLYSVDSTDTSLLPFQVLFKALSVRDLDFIRGFEGSQTNELNLVILQRSIIRFFNVTDSLGKELSDPDISILTIPQITKLASAIFTVSTITKELFSSLQLSVNLALEPKFSTDTWDCEMCQHKGLDTFRNCKFREDYEENFQTGVIINVGEEEFDHCPMFYRDRKLTSDAFECYNTLEKGVLPEAGGTVDQTEFFTHAVTVVRSAINKRDAPKE